MSAAKKYGIRHRTKYDRSRHFRNEQCNSRSCFRWHRICRSLPRHRKWSFGWWLFYRDGSGLFGYFFQPSCVGECHTRFLWCNLHGNDSEFRTSSLVCTLRGLFYSGGSARSEPHGDAEAPFLFVVGTCPFTSFVFQVLIWTNAKEKGQTHLLRFSGLVRLQIPYVSRMFFAI